MILSGQGAIVQLIRDLTKEFSYEPGMVFDEGDLVNGPRQLHGMGPKPMVAVDIFQLVQAKAVEQDEVMQEEVPAEFTNSCKSMFTSMANVIPALPTLAWREFIRLQERRKLRITMTTEQTDVQRFSVISANAFEDVVAKLDAAIGHPDMNVFRRDVAAAKSYAETEAVVHKFVGPSGLMEFTRFDLGEILRKERGPDAPKSLRLVTGNPLIMKQMVEHVPDAGSYAPVTILIDERSDGVHLSYDRMTGFLAPYGNKEALKIARDLDSKVESLLTAAAA